MRIGNVSYAPLKAKVTRAVKSGDDQRVIQTAREVVAFFSENGWPDDWSSWRNRLADAIVDDLPERWIIEDLFDPVWSQV